MRRTNIAALLVAIVGVGACTGDIGDPLRPTNVGGEGTGATIVDFTCGDPAPLIDAPLRRLSRRQLRNTVGDVLRQLMPPGEANGVLAAVEGELGAIPRDQRPVDSEQQTGQQAFYRADQNVGSAAVEAHYGLATALGEALSSDASLDAMGLGCLVAEGTSDAACIDSLVQLLGPVTHRRPLGDDERAFLVDLASLSGVAVENARLYERATVDMMTGLKNHAYFQSRFREERERAAKRKTPLALLLTDVDKFKNFNDTFGHPTGDRVLVVLAATLKSVFGEQGLVCRYGGEEFAVIMPGADRATAADIAEHLRVSVSEADMRGERLSVSIGVVSMQDDRFTTAAAFFDAADRALYQAKSDGRNCVVGFSPTLAKRYGRRATDLLPVRS